MQHLEDQWAITGRDKVLERKAHEFVCLFPENGDTCAGSEGDTAIRI